MKGVISRMLCCSSFGCATGVRKLPSATTALSRLEPITAPSPQRPAALACDPSLMMPANGIMRSPAGPIQTTAPCCRTLQSKYRRCRRYLFPTPPPRTLPKSCRQSPSAPRRWRFTGDGDGIEAGGLESNPKSSSAVGLAPDSRQRRLGHDGVASGGRDIGASQRTGGEDEHVFRPERVDGMKREPPQKVRGQTCPARYAFVLTSSAISSTRTLPVDRSIHASLPM